MAGDDSMRAMLPGLAAAFGYDPSVLTDRELAKACLRFSYALEPDAVDVLIDIAYGLGAHKAVSRAP